MKTKALTLLTLSILLQFTSFGTRVASGTSRLWIVSNDTDMREATTWNRTGDMILVEPGTYTDVDADGIDPGVILLSTGGADVTILRRSGSTEHRFNQDDVTIDGFTFESTAAIETVRVFGDRVKILNSRFKPAAGEYGLRLSSAADFSLEGSVFDQGDGILISSGSSAGEHVFRNNEFSNLQHGIEGGSNPDLQVRIENSTFKSVNRAIDISTIQKITVQNNIFTNIGHRGVDVNTITQESSLFHNVFYRNAQAIAACNVSIRVYNSIFQENAKSIDGCSGGVVEVHHDLIWLGTWRWGGPEYIIDPETIWRDVYNPQFVDPASYDFHLAPSSEAQRLGTNGSDLGAYGGTLGNAWTRIPGTPQASPTLFDIRLEGQLEVSIGDNMQLVAEGDYEDGFYAVLTKKATWTSSNEAVLRPLGEGRFEARVPGIVEVIASYGGLSRSMQRTVLPSATDLSLIKNDSPDPVAPGDALTYTLTVTNLGPSTSSGGVVTDVLPVEVSFSNSVDGCTVAAGTVTCSFGSLVDGGSVSMSFVTVVDSTAIGPITNTATVTGNEGDPDLGNNTVTSSTAVSAPCFPLTLDHTGSGTHSEPSMSIAGCTPGNYRADEVITLTALPNPGWAVGSWTGSDHDSTTSTTNTVTMPANAHTVFVNFVEDVQPCFSLTLDRNGPGTVPMPNPISSPGCPKGEFHLGELIELTARPDSGWTVGNWSGTVDDSSVHLVNMMSMPDSAHLVVVEYVACVAERTLPSGYAEKQPILVVIEAAPADRIEVYAVEDTPPTAWSVTDVNNSGVFDSSSGTVKWGPFFDNQTRTLSYWVAPPADTTGSLDFEGVASTDGESVLICGDALLAPARFHPADTNDDWGLRINEVTAYGAAWKTGSPWPRPPAQIPINFVTNAGFLWKIGETYYFDQGLNPPWARGLTALLRPEGLAGVVQEVQMDSAVSTFAPSEYTPGLGVEVTIAVMPDSATQVYALEDEPPAGWTISGVSNGGTFDAVNGLVKWGPFFDNQDRNLVYIATPPAAETGGHRFAGQASFDVASVTIIGNRMITQQTPVNGTAVATFDSSQYTPGVGLEVAISVMPDPSTQVYALEDGPPSGWTISSISDGGTFDVVNQLVKWGPFFDNLDRDLLYVATPPLGENGLQSFLGLVSFDGSSFPVSGDRTIDHSCTYTIAPSSQSFGPAGGSSTVNVTAPTGCTWDSKSNVEWLSIDSADTGSGNGLIGYTAAANSSVTPRNGTLTIAGQTHSVNQSGISCTFTIDPTSATFSAIGGTGTVSVISSPGCSWTATSNIGWITVTEGPSGNGSGTVTYSILENLSANQRAGTISIAGETFTVTQQGTPCNYSISPLSRTHSSSSASGITVSVTAPHGCSWTATSNIGWITVTEGSSGNGSSTVTYSILENASSSQRTGTVTIANETFVVVQQGTSCKYSISPTSRTHTSESSSGHTVSVVAPSGCSWTATSNVGWISINGGFKGSGNGTVTYSMTENTGPIQRNVMVLIAGQTFEVFQDGSQLITGLVGWWPADGDAKDLGPGAHHGTAFGDIQFVPGAYGQAFSLERASQHIDVPHDPALNIGKGDFSIAFWFQANPVIEDVASILDKRSNMPNGYHIFLYEGRLGIQLADDLEGPYNFMSSTRRFDDSLHFATFSVDRDSPSGGKVYVDGEIDFVFDPTIRMGSLENDVDLVLGRRSEAMGGGAQFSGLMDEVMLFDRKLSEADALRLYGLAAWWTGNGDAIDFVSGNDGVLHGGVDFGKSYCGQAFELDGSDDYVLISDSNSLNVGTGDFSLAFWIQTNDDFGIKSILDKRDSEPTLGYHIFMIDGKPGIQLADGNGFQNYTSEVNVADGEIHLIAFTMDRDQPEGGKIYLDGVQVLSFDPTSKANSLDNTQDLFLGRRSDAFGADGFLEGKLDEIRLARRALAKHEVQILYSSCLNVFKDGFETGDLSLWSAAVGE